MEKKRTIKLDDLVLRPVSALIEKFNLFIKKIETKEKVSEVDGFVSNLLEELKDVEKGESIIYEKKIGSKFYSILLIPLRTTKGSRGTGFGLAIVQKVVKEHNGKIDVKSKVGQGTTFTVTLPKL